MKLRNRILYTLNTATTLQDDLKEVQASRSVAEGGL